MVSRKTEIIDEMAPNRQQRALGRRPTTTFVSRELGRLEWNSPVRGRSEERAMVQMAIDGDTLHLRMRGIDQILALRSELSVPHAPIAAVTIPRRGARGWYHGPP